MKNNHAINTLTNAAQHMASERLFCKLDCSPAHHGSQMAKQQFVEKVAFNFATKTFAYRTLAQSVSRSLSKFSNFLCEYCEPFIKADQLAQNVDDSDIAANSPEQLINKLPAVLKRTQSAR